MQKGSEGDRPGPARLPRSTRQACTFSGAHSPFAPLGASCTPVTWDRLEHPCLAPLCPPPESCPTDSHRTCPRLSASPVGGGAVEMVFFPVRRGLLPTPAPTSCPQLEGSCVRHSDLPGTGTAAPGSGTAWSAANSRDCGPHLCPLLAVARKVTHPLCSPNSTGKRGPPGTSLRGSLARLWEKGSGSPVRGTSPLPTSW